MKYTVDLFTFIEWVDSVDGVKFDYDSLRYIFDYLEEEEENTGEESEFYPANIHIYWTQYTREELKQEYYDLDIFSLPEEELIDKLNESTTCMNFHKVKDNLFLAQEI